MLTREENEFLTRVGPGTPGGELLRRYWHPVAVAQQLTREQPTRFVRILGHLVVYPNLDCNWFQAMEKLPDLAGGGKRTAA